VNVPDDAVRELDAHGAFVGVDVEDDAAVAVADAEPTVVAQRHYSAACLYRDASHVKRGAAQPSRVESAEVSVGVGHLTRLHDDESAPGGPMVYRHRIFLEPRRESAALERAADQVFRWSG